MTGRDVPTTGPHLLHEMPNHQLCLDRRNQQHDKRDRRVDLMRGTAVAGDQP
jgi:hypothetical protein